MTAIYFIPFNRLSKGNPNIGAVVKTPLTFNCGFLNRKLITNNPPIACPYKNNGKSFETYRKSTSISICNSFSVCDPLGPPEYPNPLKSMRCTEKLSFANKSAT